MDPKAAAKSKRSHTVHGRRSHQTPTAAAAHRQNRAAAAASSSSSSSGPRSRNLPSNWDRYDAEADDPAPAAECTGEVPPRSKGADFAFLLEQARAQPLEARGLGAPWLTYQDSPFDFMQPSTSMLEAKGEGILSWCEDDNFILEDDLVPDFEADASEDNEILIQCDTSAESDAKDSLVQHNFKDIDAGKDVISHHCANNIHSDDQMKTDRQLQCFEEEKTTSSPKISTRLVHSESEDKSYTRIMDAVPGTGHSEGSKFEVAVADELDTLLNSLGGTHLSSSNLDGSFGNNSTMKVNKSNEKITSSTFSKSLALAPLDVALDDLLSETSLSVQNEGFAASSLTSQPTFNSDHNIDFRYAKQTEVTSINDSVDDLLSDTSLCLNDQRQTTAAQAQDNISNVSAPQHSGPTNVSDHFDSWFDSL